MQSRLSWEEKIEIETSYYKEHGHLIPSHKDRYKGYPIGKWVDNQRQKKIKGRLTAEQIGYLESIGMVWSVPSARWDVMMRALEEFFEENGNCDVPKGTMVRFGEGEYDLNGWLTHKRVYRAKLSEEQRHRLEAIGVIWSSRDYAWERGFDRARVFFEEYGHLSVREAYRDDSGFGLGRWIRQQRDDYAKGSPKLSAERIVRLESIGMVWRCWDKSGTSWAEQAIYYYVRKICPDAVNGDRSQLGFELDVWVPSLRLAIEYDGPFHADAETQARDIAKNKKCSDSGVLLIRVRESSLPAVDFNGSGIRYLTLSESYELKNALEDIERILKGDFGVTASMGIDLERDRQEIDDLIARLNDGRWHKRYEELKSYHKRFGTTNIPKNQIVNGKKLSLWVCDQRKAYRKNRLEPYKVELLNELGFEWNPLEDQWIESYAKLKKYVETSGRLPMLRDDEALCYWMYDQRKRVALSDEKTALLRELGVLGESKADRHFQTMLSKLREFKARNGHCIVPRTEGDGEEFPLGNWAIRMRTLMRRGDLPDHWRSSLLEVGFPLDNKEAKFQRNLGIAIKYSKEHGHLRVPQKYVDRASGIRLGAWINTQRLDYKGNRLSPERIKALEELGMDWVPCKRQSLK